MPSGSSHLPVVTHHGQVNEQKILPQSVAGRTGFEPATSGLEGRRSILAVPPARPVPLVHPTQSLWLRVKAYARCNSDSEVELLPASVHRMGMPVVQGEVLDPSQPLV